MDERKACILRTIVEEYIRNADPVGSKSQLLKNATCVSSATIRNDMAHLEQNDYIRSPHTSSGRVPTEKGYQYYLKHFVKIDNKINGRNAMQKAFDEYVDEENSLKNLAKIMAELSGETVMIAFNPEWSYYTGISNLIQKPDFQELDMLNSISESIDRLDDVLSMIFDQVTDQSFVMIGNNNPFGEWTSAMLIKYNLQNHDSGILGILGPLRMNYARNLSLIEGAKEIIENN